MNLVNVRSFIPSDMTVLLISGENGTKLGSSVLDPRRTCPVTLAERASTYRCRAATTSVGVPGLPHQAPTYHVSFVILSQAHYSSTPGEYEYRPPLHPPGRMILIRGMIPLDLKFTGL
ncbi:hypothetical protein LIER_32561 [Lithospermum erythrorhizon]|uniref:Uncharacterized protein n=1 Tax=Lithospermum erythrorhizon TaxID=34254 RepID=A0AAV3P6C8_LITER